ncbi:MAG: D-alanyl-D-alanine carboxypeptidase family protein [Bacilli bacterium]
MKKLIIFFLLLLFPLNCYAISDTSRSSILMDIDSGRVLYEKGADEERLIASITKIMTAVIAIENASVDEIVTVGEEVLSMYGSNVYVEVGEKLSLKDLLYGLLMRSGNDAAVVIANYISKDEKSFVKLMNKKANELGMTNTTFSNCHGLDDDTKNYSTARDMAILSSYAYQLDIYKEITKTTKYETKSNLKSYVWYNRNKLLTLYDYATGGKNGYTPDAGRTLVTTASKDNLNLTVVTLADSNEYDTHISLYNYGYDNYKKYKILDKEKFSIENDDIKNAYIKNDFYYPLTEDESNKINTKVKITKMNNYNNNDKIGTVSVYLNDKRIYEENIYIKVKEKNKIINWFKKIF